MVDFPRSHRVAYEAVDEDEIQLIRTLIVVTYLGILTLLAGFRCDGASIPRIAWSLTGYHPLHPRIVRGAVAHDGLYRTGLISRRKADKVFYKSIREDGVGRIKASVFYRSVRLFGGKHYNKKGKQSKFVYFMPTNHTK